MTVKEILIKARALISKPENWCQGSYAIDALGESTPSFSKTAVKFCALGALRKIKTDLGGVEIFGCELVLRAVVGTPDIPSFNDRADHAAVLDMYDKAIANCKE
jgi:hypothetical protein